MLTIFGKRLNDWVNFEILGELFAILKISEAFEVLFQENSKKIIHQYHIR